VERVIPAPVGPVWRLLVDLEAWPRWGPSVRRAELHGGATELGLGARGTVWTAVGVALPFRIVEFEPLQRWSWTVAGVRATGHHVAASGTGACRVRFTVPWWAPGYLPVCAVALSRIERLAHGGPDAGPVSEPGP
jgi:uncharacterized protein YndB with AHSA1/START domain